MPTHSLNVHMFLRFNAYNTTHMHTHTRTHTHTHTQSHISGQWDIIKVFEKRKVFKEALKELAEVV